MKTYWVILFLFIFQACSFNSSDNFAVLQQKLARIDDPEDRQACVDRFMQKLSKKDYPIFENDSTVVLLYQGHARQVEMIGDVNYWTNPAAFTKIKNTDLHYLRIEIKKNSLLEYWLIINGEQTQIDSLNQYQIKNEFGLVSQIVNHNNPVYIKQLKSNSEKLYKTYLVPIQSHQYVKCHVYFPPRYNDYEYYPLAIFLDGKKYIDFGDAPTIIENLINAGKIEPIVAVFAELGFDESSDRSSFEYFDWQSHIIANQIIEFVENRFSVLNSPEDRLLIGKSAAASINILTALKNPDKFSNVFVQSGYLSADNFTLNNLVKQRYNKSINFYFQIGIYERNVSHMIIPPDETDFYQITKEFINLLRSEKYTVKLDEFVAGHSWGNWKAHLSEGLIYFFSKKASNPG